MAQLNLCLSAVEDPKDPFASSVQRWQETWDCPGVPGWGEPASEQKEGGGETEGRIKRN